MHWRQIEFTIGRTWVRSSQSPVSLSLISFYTPGIVVHTLSCHMRDFSHDTPPLISRSQRWQSGGRRFHLVLLRKGRIGVLLLLLKWMYCRAQNLLRRPAADSLPFSHRMFCCRSLPLVWWHNSKGADPLHGRVSHPPKSTVG